MQIFILISLSYENENAVLSWMCSEKKNNPCLLGNDNKHFQSFQH